MKTTPILWFLTLAFLLAPWGCSSEDIVYSLTTSGIKIEVAIHSRFVPKDSIVLKSIKIVNLDSDNGITPVKRLWGVGQPAIDMKPIKFDEYFEGWFQLENGEIALIFLSEHEEAIYLKTNMKPPKQVQIVTGLTSKNLTENNQTFCLLLGTSAPEELMKIMQKRWGFKD